MATGPRYAVRFRRRRESKTDFKGRLALLKSGITRFAVRKTNAAIICQFIKEGENGDKTITGISSTKLKEYGWKNSFKNLPAAYLSGYLAGKIALKAKVNKAIFDIGLQSKKNSKIFAALKGAVDAGVEITHDPEIIPKENRLTGAHIKDSVPKDVESVKKKIDNKDGRE